MQLWRDKLQQCWGYFYLVLHSPNVLLGHPLRLQFCQKTVFTPFLLQSLPHDSPKEVSYSFRFDTYVFKLEV